MEDATRLTLHVLGSIRAERDGVELGLGGPKQRAVLAILVANLGRAVSADALVDGVWEENPPDTARKTLQGYVHHLRAALGDVIQTDAVGYRLTVAPALVDAVRFEEASIRGRGLLAQDPAEASRVLADALSMWHGPPYADLAGLLALEPEIARLTQRRLDTVEDRIEADLHRNVSGQLVGELESLTREFPLRERLWALKMRALYAAGRQAEALRAFSQARQILAEELGIDPSGELRDLEEQILRQDPALATARASNTPVAPNALRGYELRGAEGRGATGTVYRAYQTSVGREVAIKVIRPDIANAPDFIEFFEDEARRIGTLEHPHILPLHDAWREPGAAYQVRPWMAGGSLEEQMEEGHVPTARAIQVLDDIAGALSYAHRRGIDHCRLKPTNVLFDGEDNTYITDFAVYGTGAATASVRDEAYLAPELASGLGPHVPGTDIYGLAVLAHELFTGRLPEFDDAGHFIPPLEHGQALARELSTGLQAHPEARHPRVESLIRGLRQASGTDVVSAAASLAAPDHSTRNPFKGLRAFQQTDAADFFGRDRLVHRLAAQLDKSGFVAVVGPSGIGKSSVVKAGLIPALRQRRPLGAPPLLITEMFPGAHPFEELLSALSAVAIEHPSESAEELAADPRALLRIAKEVLPDDQSTLLIVIDQFEELFSLVSDSTSRQHFLAALAHACAGHNTPIQVVVTLRADFYDRPLEYPDFGSLLEHNTVPVMAPTAEELAQAISGPARAVGLELEPGLVSEIVHDVSEQPGGLPLLQYSLTELFDRRGSDTLTVADYRATGGVLGALGRRAEDLWSGLGGGGREAGRQLFLRLVTVGEGSDDVRRRVRRSELADLRVSPTSLQATITAFGSHRLLSFDRDPVTRGPTIEVAHEALLREWDRLRGWIDSRRADLILHRRLHAALEEWLAAGRDPSYLLHGGRLSQVESWAFETDISLTATEAEFLRESQAQRDAEAERQRQIDRRLRTGLVAVTALFIIALVAGVVAVLQARKAGNEAAAAVASREEAETRRLALEAPGLVDANRQVALLLAAEAFNRDPGPTTIGALQQVLAESDGFLGYVGLGHRYLDIEYGPDRNLVALRPTALDVMTQDSGSVLLTVPMTNAHLLATDGSGPLAAVVDRGVIRVINLTTGTSVRELPLSPGQVVTAVAFDQTGTRLAYGDESGMLAVVEVTTGTEVLRVPDAHWEREAEGAETPAHQPGLAQFGVRTIAWSPTGSSIATGGLVMARLWDVATGEMVAEVWHDRPSAAGGRVPAAATAVGFATANDDALIVASTLNVATYRREGTTFVRSQESVFPNRLGGTSANRVDADVVLGPSVAVLVLIGGEFVALPLDGTSEPRAFNTQLSGFPIVALAPDEGSVAVGGTEGISLWSLTGRGLINQAVPRDGQAEATFTRDGSRVVLSSPDRRGVLLYDLSPENPRKLPLPTGFPIHFAWLGLSDGLLSWNFDDLTVRYHPFATYPDGAIPIGQGSNLAGATNSDATLYAMGGGPPLDTAVVRVFDMQTGELVSGVLEELLPEPPDRLRTVTSLSFSPSGNRLIGATNDGMAVIWDTQTWTVVETVSQGGGQVVVAEYSPDGAWLVTMSADGAIVIRDPASLRQVGEPLTGQTDSFAGYTHGPVFTPDHRYMVTTADGVGRLWDLESRTMVGAAFPSDSGTSPGTSFDGRRLGTFRGDRLLVWNLDVGAWPEVACRAAGRNLTAEEWNQFGPNDTPYRATCPMWTGLDG